MRIKNPRSLIQSLISLKQNILEQCLAGAIPRKEGAMILKIHPKSLSRLLGRYQRGGKTVLIPCAPGPRRSHTPKNRTPRVIEKRVLKLASRHPNWGSIRLSRAVGQEGEKLNQSTVWRILKRHKKRK